MAKLTPSQRRALKLMETRPSGKISMRRGEMEARTPTINSLWALGLAEWCDDVNDEPQAARITESGRAALKEK